jgi:prepilin-type N-terminal cleavage/methylation domain-containing protein
MKYASRDSSRGFTVIELIVVIALLAAASLLFFIQKNNLQTANLDEHRKIAVNSIYYNLEQVFYPKNNYYPATLSTANLPAMDPSLLTDTNGVKIDGTLDGVNSDENSDDSAKYAYEYRYEPTDCDSDGKCKSYTLRVSLSNEAEYVKKSQHK